MHRIWDWIVSLTMIGIAIVGGGIVAAMVAIPVTLGLDYLVNLQGRQGGLAWIGTSIALFAILQAVGFYDFYRRRRANTAIGEAGLFFLVPRAIERMRTGQELAGFIDDGTGKPTTIGSPINAGRRTIAALSALAASIAAMAYGIQMKGDWSLVLMALGVIGVPVGLAYFAQAMLAYAGFIRRN